MDSTKHPVVCFGEVLWDILPSGAVPGGAPMNVTYHLHKQNKNPALITSIGQDEKGNELKEIFSQHQVCTDFFQVDQFHETGKVYAYPNEHNEVVYDIVKPVAWDFIECSDSLTDLVSNAEYFVFGSLASRSSISKKTLFRLIETANKKVLDINLRAPHYDKMIVEELLRHTNFLKLNIGELDLIAGWFSDYTSLEEKIRFLANKFEISNVVVTMGGDGAVLFYQNKFYRHPGFKVVVQDTVGSGDAFLAGLLSRLMNNEDPQQALMYANALGALIATKKGACPGYETSEVLELISQQTVIT